MDATNNETNSHYVYVFTANDEGNADCVRSGEKRLLRAALRIVMPTPLASAILLPVRSGKINGMTKIWNATIAMKELGWM